MDFEDHALMLLEKPFCLQKEKIHILFLTINPTKAFFYLIGIIDFIIQANLKLRTFVYMDVTLTQIHPHVHAHTHKHTQSKKLGSKKAVGAT